MAGSGLVSGVARLPEAELAGDALQQEYIQRPLFGGALAVHLPSRFVDVSVFRQIPDTQEVFAHAETDQSIIVEVLEMATEANAEEVALFHFNSLAHDNDAIAVQLEQQPSPLPLPDGGVRSLCWGLQTVAKFNEGISSANQVRVYVACFRLPLVATDVVLSYNAPVFISNQSSSAQGVDTAELTQVSSEQVLDTFINVCNSLLFLDMSIFMQN